MQTYVRRKHSVTYYNPVQAYNGYTLISPFGAGETWLIDMKGRPVHNWKVPSFSCRLLPDGHLLAVTGEGLVELDWDGESVWSYEDKSAGSDFLRLDNGNTLYLRSITVPYEVAGKVEGGVAGTEKGGMSADALREVSPSGKVAWEWLAYEHLDLEKDVICPLCHRNQWTAGGSLALLDDGHIVTSFTRTNYLYIIDKASGEIKWRWGLRELAHPTHTVVLEDGNIMVFDAGLHPYGLISFQYSRLVVIEPKEGKMLWEYRDPAAHCFYSAFMGGCQQLPNGNVLVTESQTGRVFEITYNNKEVVWEFVNPFYSNHPLYGYNNILFRAYRYGVEYSGIIG